MSEKTWPLTIKEALQQMHIRISDEDKADLGKMQKNVFLATMHHQLGRWLRNTMGLWSGNNDLREACREHIDPPENLADALPHPDAVSGVLMGMFWEQLQN